MKPFDSVEQPEIVFCDNHLLVANKPSGWLTQPDDSGRLDLEAFAKAWVKQTFHKPGDVFLHCIHRLDLPVSGLVLFAKTSKALSRLNEMSRTQQIRRLYLAEVEGILPHKTGILKHFLVHGQHRAHLAKASDPFAKQAILTYSVQAFKEHTTLVQIELETGRYHQIRAQFSAEGHPIVGDGRYGAKELESEWISLCCTDLLFAHPVTKETLDFHAQAPFG